MKNNIYKFTLNSDIKVKIHIVNKIRTIDNYQFFKEYKISNLFFGKFFIKRLIKKIFKYKINKIFFWDNFFWDKITLNLYNTKIHINNSNLIELDNILKLKVLSVSERRINTLQIEKIQRS